MRNYFIVILILLSLTACEKQSKDALKVDKAYIEHMSGKDEISDHRLIVCFKQNITSNYFGFAKNNRFKHKLKVQISSRKGWTQDMVKGVQKFQRLGSNDACMEIINENYYHSFMKRDAVTNDNFSKENITFIKVDVLKYDLDNDNYSEIDKYTWKADY
jgi:hypothetical protein